MDSLLAATASVLSQHLLPETDTETETSMALVPTSTPTTSSIGFICAICCDSPPSMKDVASISGCNHQFCFDCIATWAKTENKCPCCKARFRTIDRVVELPSSANDGLMDTSVAREDEVNTIIISHVVEDRDQESSTSIPPFLLFALHFAHSIGEEFHHISVENSEESLRIIVTTASGLHVLELERSNDESSALGGS